MNFRLTLALVLLTLKASAGSWSTYTWVETNPVDGVLYTNVVALWSDHCYAKGIFVNLPGGGDDTSDDYTDPRYQNFLKQNQLAHLGVRASQVHVVIDSTLTHALTNAAIQSGHNELTNCPRYGFGISAGGSSLRIAETNQAPWVSLNYGSAPVAAAPHYIGGYTNILQSPAVCLAVAVDNSGYTNNTAQYVYLNRTSNFLGAVAIKEKGLHAQGTNVYWIPSLVNMQFALSANRIPTNQCVLNYQPRWNLYDETNGWLLDPYDYSTASIWTVTNWNSSGINGHSPTNCSWAQNEAVATILRAWGTWNCPITLTQPTGGDDTTPPTYAIGATVTVRVNAKGMAGVWTNLVIKDCAFNPPVTVFSATDGTTTNWTKTDFAQGAHYLVAEIVTNNVTRTTLPIMFSVDVTNSYCASCMDQWVYMSPSGSSSGAGTRASPYGIEAFTNANNEVKPGGALIVMNGSYDKGGTNFVTMDLRGHRVNPTYVVADDTPYGATNRTHPRILAQLNQTGSNIIVGGLILTTTNLSRVYSSDPGFTGWYINSPNSTNYDCHVNNNLGDGFEFYSGASNSMMFLCSAYNNWFYDSAQHRCRGHNFYVQGNGIKTIRGCVSANSGDIGWHIYGQSQVINNITMDKSYGYESGITASNSTHVAEILFGGFIPATNANLTSSWFYQSTNFDGSSAEFGYSVHENHDGVIRLNDFLYGDSLSGSHSAVETGVWTNHLDFQSNTIVAGSYVLTYFTNFTTGYSVNTLDKNAYYTRFGTNTTAFNINGIGFKKWMDYTNLTLYDIHSTYSTTFPTVDKSVLIVDDFLTNSCLVAVEDWSGASTISVNISSAVGSGTNINVWTYQDLFGSPALSQAYSGGSISIPKSTMVDNFYQVYYIEAAASTNAPTTFTNTIASSNPSSGVSVTVSPNDNNGSGNGSTSFTRVYNSSTSVTLTAPTTASGNNFNKWQKDGVDYSVNPAITVTIAATNTYTAVYSTPAAVTSGSGEFARRVNSPF